MKMWSIKGEKPKRNFKLPSTLFEENIMARASSSARSTVFDCPTQLTLIFMILYFCFCQLCQLYSMTNIKSFKYEKHCGEIC